MAAEQLALFDAPEPRIKIRRPDASDPVLILLCEVAVAERYGFDDGIGAPEIGHKPRTVDTAIMAGWLTRSYVGDSDTEQGPRRLHLTDTGREQIELDNQWATAGGWIGVIHHVTAHYLIAKHAPDQEVS